MNVTRDCGPQKSSLHATSVSVEQSPLNTRSLVWVKCDLVGSLVQEEHNAYHA